METTKVLGQAIPVAATLTTLYTVPGGTSTVVSTLMACNQALTSTSIRVAVAVAGAADTEKQYLYRDLTLTGLNSLALTAGLTLAATDVIRAYSLSGLVSFNLFGVEVS